MLPIACENKCVYILMVANLNFRYLTLYTLLVSRVHVESFQAL